MISAIPFRVPSSSGKRLCCVSIIDPETGPATGNAVEALNNVPGWHANLYSSGEAFLDDCHFSTNQPSCIVTEVTLPGISGLGLHSRLQTRGIAVPMIFVSSSPSVAMIVQAMKSGALDFLEKPLHRQLLMERVQIALDIDAEAHWQRSRRADVFSQLDALSPREREILQYLVEGKSTKEIAASLRIGLKTVAKHRIRVLTKMQVDTVVELIRLLSPGVSVAPAMSAIQPFVRPQRALAKPR
jgi:FixJ family two-component response regulator